MIGLKGIPITFSGPENFVEQISTRLVERGHSVTVYCRPYAIKKWLQQSAAESENKTIKLNYSGINLKVLPTIPTKHFDAIVHSTLSSIHTLSQQYDIIHYQTLGPSTVSFIPQLFKKAKIITSVLGLDWQRAKWGWFARNYLKFGEFTSIRFADFTHVISYELKRYYERKYRRKVYYIPTGVEILPPRPIQVTKKYGIEKEKFILFLSRLVPEKGAHFLIGAYKKLKTDLRLVIAGGALYEEVYINRLKKIAGKNVIFTGFVSDDEMAELFSNAYLYVLPSEVEGLPHSLLQALSYGRCVVASDIEANREALDNCGYTFKSSNSDHLASVLQKLIENKGLVEQEKEKGINHVREKYDWEHVVDEFERLYQKSLS